LRDATSTPCGQIHSQAWFLRCGRESAQRFFPPSRFKSIRKRRIRQMKGDYALLNTGLSWLRQAGVVLLVVVELGIPGNNKTAHAAPLASPISVFPTEARLSPLPKNVAVFDFPHTIDSLLQSLCLAPFWRSSYTDQTRRGDRRCLLLGADLRQTSRNRRD
jgi:hypothetical protein